MKEVDYSVTPTQLMDYFSTCGSITRLKILTTRAGAPKGYFFDFILILVLPTLSLQILILSSLLFSLMEMCSLVGSWSLNQSARICLDIC